MQLNNSTAEEKSKCHQKSNREKWAHQMKKLPTQIYILASAVLLHYWPEQLTLSGSDSQLLFSVITLQLVFVMSCNILVSELWKYAVIMIEVFCMLFNTTFFLLPSVSAQLHEQIMLCAFILELLIITLSLQGAVVGRSNDYRLPLASFSLGGLRSSAFDFYRRARSLS